MRICLLLAVFILLNACSQTPNIQTAREPEARLSPYLEMLRRSYLSISDVKWRQNEWSQARFYGDKALEAANGTTPVATPPTDVTIIDPSDRGMLQQTYTTLMNLQQQGYTNTMPAEMANIQVNYDCWLMEAAHSPASELKQGCRSYAQQTAQEIIWYRQQAELRRNQPQLMPRQLIVYFGINDAKLDERDHRVIAAAKKLHETQGYSQLLLAGFTDKTGRIDYNRKLRKRRIEAVKEGFGMHGIDANHITILSDEESEPYRPVTHDASIAEARNRSVVIQLLP